MARLPESIEVRLVDLPEVRALVDRAMGWRDATKEEPPDCVRLLVCDRHGAIRFGHYLRDTSINEGCRLPNGSAEAVWLINDLNTYQGRANITHWALVLPPQAKSP